MSKDVVKLGLMPPLTGLVGIYGSEISRAGQIACQVVNENGGVLGRMLELVIEDDGSLPETAVAAAERLVDQHHCTAIIGNLLSNSRISVAYRVAEPRKIPYLNFSFYEGSILSRYFFHFGALPNQQIDRMIPYMRKQYGPRMFFAGNNYEWPRGSIHAGKHSLEGAGGEVVGEEYCPIGVDTETIERLLDQVEEASPDVFVPYFAGADQVLLLTRFTERGLKKRMAVVMGHYDEMMASQLSPEVREGFYSSNTYFMTVDTEENRNYLRRLSDLADVNGVWPQGDGILTNFGEGAYVCVRAFAQAANKAGSLDPEALVGALKTINVSAPQGIVQMNHEHHHARVNTYLSRCNADGVFSIVEKFGAIDPVQPARYKHQRIANQATLEDDIRFQARILEQMSEGVILTSYDYSIVYANAGADRLFGYDNGEMIGLPMSQLYDPHDNDSQETANSIMRTLKHKGEWQGEIRNIKKDGIPIWCFTTVSTFTHPVYGEVWLGVQRDITENKNAEKELNLHREHLEELVKERTKELESAQEELMLKERLATLGQLTATVSHELRNPLGAMLSSLFLIKKASDKEDGAVQKAVEMVSRNIKRCDRIIDELLDFTRITVLDLRATRFDEWLESVIDEQNIHSGIQVEKEFSLKDMELEVDADRLRRAVINVVDNACHAMLENNQPGDVREGSRLNIKTIAGDGCIEILVTDNGSGVAENIREKIFEPMFSTKGFGVGLGMPTVRHIMQQHGGDVGVESKEGKGTTVTLWLPIAAGRRAVA